MVECQLCKEAGVPTFNHPAPACIHYEEYATEVKRQFLKHKRTKLFDGEDWAEFSKKQNLPLFINIERVPDNFPLKAAFVYWFNRSVMLHRLGLKHNLSHKGALKGINRDANILEGYLLLGKPLSVKMASTVESMYEARAEEYKKFLASQPA